MRAKPSTFGLPPRAPAAAAVARSRTDLEPTRPHHPSPPARPGPAGQEVGTIITAQAARCETRFGTEPSTRRAPLIPRLPTTIIWAPVLAA